jgi:hypothetical protein
MSQNGGRARRNGRALIFSAGLAALIAAPGVFARTVEARHAVAGGRLTPALEDGALGVLFGRSGKLSFRLAKVGSGFRIPILAQLFGPSTLETPDVYAAADSAVGRPFSLITMLPFSAKKNGQIGNYRIGFWPGEKGRTKLTSYANPDGFIRVTPENVSTRVSDHFVLGNFLTHDQQAVWPKYLVLREELVDKLELVINDLNAHGTSVQHMAIMSGFRTPQYNETGGDPSGRASLSRHQYGDAADVYVDNNRDGRMDDLNRDGRVDTRDARVILDAVERVERAHPDVVGGVGVYHATNAHGPFAHVDVRGNRARWGEVG